MVLLPSLREPARSTKTIQWADHRLSHRWHIPELRRPSFSPWIPSLPQRRVQWNTPLLPTRAYYPSHMQHGNHNPWCAHLFRDPYHPQPVGYQPQPSTVGSGRRRVPARALDQHRHGQGKQPWWNAEQLRQPYILARTAQLHRTKFCKGGDAQSGCRVVFAVWVREGESWNYCPGRHREREAKSRAESSNLGKGHGTNAGENNSMKNRINTT